MKLSEIIKNKKEFKIGYLGGSITEGAGSSTNDKCYASLVTSELAKIYPDTSFECINAGVGGTGSALGLFRMKRDMLSKEPDMVFVEFAVNDNGLSTTGIYMENIVREVNKYRKDIPIVLIYTTQKSMLEEHEKGSTPQSITKHSKLAEYYGIIQIDVGYTLFKKYGKSIDEFASKYFIDGCHPNDTGYRGYTDIILEALQNAEFKGFDESKEYLFERKFTNPDMILCEGMADDTWKLSYNTMYDRLPNYIYSFNKGDELTFEFDGSFLGAYYTIEKDSGIMEYSIDGGEWKERSTWDKYALQFNRACSSILEEKLTEGHHVLKIRNSGRKDEKSEGYYIRIGAFLIG